MPNKEAAKQQCEEIVNALRSLKDEESVPKNVKLKLDMIITDLNRDEDMQTKVGKSLHHLDEIAEDLNLQSFIRTQIWSISGMLEKLN